MADDKLLNARVDDVLAKEGLRLRKLQAKVASQNASRLSRSTARSGLSEESPVHAHQVHAPAVDN